MVDGRCIADVPEDPITPSRHFPAKCDPVDSETDWKVWTPICQSCDEYSDEAAKLIEEKKSDECVHVFELWGEVLWAFKLSANTPEPPMGSKNPWIILGLAVLRLGVVNENTLAGKTFRLLSDGSVRFQASSMVRLCSLRRAIFSG